MTQIACRLAAFDEAQQRGWQTVKERLRSAIQEVRELPDGYSFRLPGESEIILTAAECISLERRCCPFLRFEIEVESEGPAWIRLLGAPGVKEFLQNGDGQSRDGIISGGALFFPGG